MTIIKKKNEKKKSGDKKCGGQTPPRPPHIKNITKYSMINQIYIILP